MENDVLSCKADELFYLLGHKWLLHVVKVLEDGIGKFNAIQELLPGISANVLTQRLRLLEENGLVERKIIIEKPIMIRYSLTKKGGELAGYLRDLEKWWG